MGGDGKDDGVKMEGGMSSGGSGLVPRRCPREGGGEVVEVRGVEGVKHKTWR